jgi:UDP-galactopyranose mutase
MARAAGRRILIVGAGFSGAVVARELAEAGYACLVIDQRPHVAGNCHTARDEDTGVMTHVYGPHIFNTSNLEVWEYIQRFCTMGPFIYRVKASTPRGMFSFPINLHTINQFFGKRFNPCEARAFLSAQGDSTINEPQNFEEQALKTIGRDLYDAFFHGYTKKQWGCEPAELPAQIFKRLPIRFTYDDNYFASRYQGIPVEGYTGIVRRMLDHPLIEVKLNTLWEPAAGDEFATVFYTGPIDAYYEYRHGRLGYRTVYWDKWVGDGDYQGNSVINYPDLADAFTRIHEHKHFAPWEEHSRTIVFTEYSKETAAGDVPYYPKRLSADVNILAQYTQLAAREENVFFLGRLATYRYLDMHVVIAEALALARRYVAAANGAKENCPRFSAAPI